MQELDTVVDGLAVASTRETAAHPVPQYPLLVVLHGGAYTSDYFKIAGSGAGSFIDIANRNGFDVLRIDRPGYGNSAQLADDDNTYARQAEILNSLVAGVLGEDQRPVVLVGHSIGGMIGLEIAALQPTWRLIGVATSGMGARLTEGGPGEQLGAIPGDGLVDLPVDMRNQILYGPASTISADTVEAAQTSFAPAPIVELRAASLWPTERLDHVAAAVTVPVHHILGEYDSIWTATNDALELFRAKFDSSVPVSSELTRHAGHSVDHHLVGAAMHHRQLAFAHSCAVL